MLKACPTHQRNTSQRQGADLDIHISRDENPYHVTNVEYDENNEVLDFEINPPLEDASQNSVKQHTQKPHQIAGLLQEQLHGYTGSAYPNIPFETDSFQKDGTHVLKVKMPAKHPEDLKAWLDIMQILEPLQEKFYRQNNLISPYAFNINSPAFQVKKGESVLRYKLANLKARIASLLPIRIEWTSHEQWNKLKMLYAHQDFIHDALLPKSFKSIK